MRYRIRENDNDSNSSQHEEFDSTIMNFLIRRIKVEKRKLGDYTDEGLNRLLPYFLMGRH